jgi:hypothetical protein
MRVCLAGERGLAFCLFLSPAPVVAGRLHPYRAPLTIAWVERRRHDSRDSVDRIITLHAYDSAKASYRHSS